MRVVIALGGNALLKRDEPMTVENQRRNVETAVKAILPLAEAHELIITHGNGPQVGLLALQSMAYEPEQAQPLDLLDAQSEGMIGYLIARELTSMLPRDRHCVTLLTQIEIDADDPAFAKPTKPIGPLYDEDEARRLAQRRGWQIAPDSTGWRRVVASPKPQRIVEIEAIELLAAEGVIVICAGGGGIPIVAGQDGRLTGVEAVIDKDFASALLARALEADALLMLTDVDGVYRDWGEPGARLIRRISPTALNAYAFAPGTMGPKVEAACAFVTQTGGTAGIGALADAAGILRDQAGTLITADAEDVVLG
ncbi:MAG: carbamate kinase [Gammaproteobacteria bacterium]|nr:carbamate kinase [Gammaproteobacteria bacterium]